MCAQASGSKPSTIALRTPTSAPSCLTASSATAGANLVWEDCDSRPTQRFRFTDDGQSHGGDCSASQCRNVQLADSGLCVEFHSSGVPCPNGGSVCLWTCNGGWLQNLTWSSGVIKLAPGAHHIHPSTSGDCLSEAAPPVAESVAPAFSDEGGAGGVVDVGWKALPSSTAVRMGDDGRAVVTVQLERGCAMVRVRPRLKNVGG